MRKQELLNQRGSAITLFLMLPLSIVVVFSVASYSNWFNSHLKIQTRDHVQMDSASLQTSLKMILNTRESCRQNLNAAGLGSTSADLSSDKNRQIYLPASPGTVGSGTNVFIGANTQYNTLTINSVSFNPSTMVANTQEKSYIVNLEVKYTNHSMASEKIISIPVYFVASATGALTDCFGTLYSLPGVTVEELMCQQFKDSNYTYLPGAQTCGLKSGPIAKN